MILPSVTRTSRYLVSPQIINRAGRIKAGPGYKIPSIFSAGGVSLAIRGWYVPTHSRNPNCRLLFQTHRNFCIFLCSVNGLYQLLIEQSAGGIPRNC